MGDLQVAQNLIHEHVVLLGTDLLMRVTAIMTVSTTVIEKLSDEDAGTKPMVFDSSFREYPLTSLSSNRTEPFEGPPRCEDEMLDVMRRLDLDEGMIVDSLSRPAF